MTEQEYYLQTKLQEKYSRVAKITTVASQECQKGLCDGSGVILYDIDIENYGIAEKCIYCACNATHKGNADNSRARSNMPSEYMDKSYCDFDWSLYGKSDNKILKDSCTSFIKDFTMWEGKGKGLYLFSKTMGSGKTLLACVLANEISKLHNANIRFTTVGAYMALVSDEMKAERGEHKESEVIKKARLLVIDDIGNAAKKDWTDTQIYELINYRLSNRKITIFTSNVVPQALKMDGRIIQRIEKMAIAVELPEFSVRAMLANKENDEFLRGMLKG